MTLKWAANCGCVSSLEGEMSRLRHIFVALPVFLILLGPAPASAQSAKDVAEAAALYERAQAFVRQQAWREALELMKKAEGKHKTNEEYVLAVAELSLKTRRPQDALNRYLRIYRAAPANTRALRGLADTYETFQNYRDAAVMWKRLSLLTDSDVERGEATARWTAATEQFIAHYEIAENPAGGAPNLLSPLQESVMGALSAEATLSTTSLLADSQVEAYVSDLARRLVSHAKGFPGAYRVLVLDTSVINAFATPGFIGVNRGLIEGVDSEAQLAAVLAHEIGHTVAHHAAKKVTLGLQMTQIQQNLQQDGGAVSGFMARAYGLLGSFGQLKFSRDEESQADRLAAHIVFDAGLDPRAALDNFRLFETITPSKAQWLARMMDDHPQPVERFNAISDYLALFPERESAAAADGRFEQIKKRLSQLPPAPDDRTMVR